jgi:hypothetical protein
MDLFAVVPRGGFMPARTPPVWCADLLVNVDPCAKGADCTAQEDGYSGDNEVWSAADEGIRLAGAANEVVMFQLVIEKRAGKLEGLSLEGLGQVQLGLFANIPVPIKPILTERDRRGEIKSAGGCQVRKSIEGCLLDDPVVPVDLADCAASIASIVKKAPRVPGRRRSTYTVELLIPKGTTAGELSGKLQLKLKGQQKSCSLKLRVYDFELPDEATCTADINNYSRVNYPGGPDADVNCDDYIKVMHQYFRLAREHRAMFHLLPYSHAGSLSNGYAPVLSGRGRNRKIVDWTDFDRHWSDLLDGSAYRGCRFGEHPVEYLYMPTNLFWPAHFENYGKPGFKVEFQNVHREMGAHFSEKKWNATKMEVFFNHKSRWKYSPWDMDEIYYEHDNDATIDFARMATEAVADYPDVKFINRIDSSWIFEKSARTEIGDVVQLWVVNRGSHSEAPDEVALLRGKGQEIWFYGGPGSLSAPDRLDSLRWPWIAWGRDTDGFCWWNGQGFGSWEQVDIGTNHCLYPGQRFGIDGPLASLRFKVLLRGMQDHAYFTLLSQKTGSRQAGEEVIARTIGCQGREDWYQRAEGSEVSGADIQSSSATSKPWNTAPRSAWAAARVAVAEAIEKAQGG